MERVTAIPPADLPVEVDPVFGCWLWRGKLDDDGYGRINGRLAHVAVFERFRGEVPAGKERDHECRRRECVRPAHIALVTRSQQEQRKSWVVRARRKVCQKGHDMNMNAMVLDTGGRVCRTCSRASEP